jgi:hypothetical protein
VGGLIGPAALSAPPLRPAALCLGPGHAVVYGNPSFVGVFGRHALGVPAREGLTALPREAFTLLDAVLSSGRPLARWIRLADEPWRLTVTPRLDPETAEVYGVRLFLRRSSDLPAPLARADQAGGAGQAPSGSGVPVSPPRDGAERGASGRRAARRTTAEQEQSRPPDAAERPTE